MATKNTHRKILVAASVAAVIYLCRTKISAAIATASAPAAPAQSGPSCVSSAPPTTAAPMQTNRLQGLHAGQTIWIRGRYKL
jgi:hypothetical protein